MIELFFFGIVLALVVQIEKFKSVLDWCILLLLIDWDILVALEWLFERSSTLIDIPFNLSSFVSTGSVSIILQYSRDITYARLIMQVRANMELWTEFVEI